MSDVPPFKKGWFRKNKAFGDVPLCYARLKIAVTDDCKQFVSYRIYIIDIKILNFEKS